MASMEGVQHLKISLNAIKSSTNNFSNENFIACGGFGKVYRGELSWKEHQSSVAIKRLDRTCGQGDREFLMEIQMLSCYRHRNLVSLIGFCDESGEKILVYEHASRGSLDNYISSPDLSWIQRLRISLGAARGLNYLHHDVGTHHRVIHRDIKCSNILLDENWEAKISDFGLSKIGPSNNDHTFLVTNACGTYGYVDPVYVSTGILTKESDVYSFGVVLFEILCGRLACVPGFQDERTFLAPLAQSYYEQKKLDEIIFPELRRQMKPTSMEAFSTIAYKCLNENRPERPTMSQIIVNLENAMRLQDGINIGRVGIWGTKATGDPHNHWSFILEKNYNLKKITIYHGDRIYSLVFTTKYNGIFHTCNGIGGGYRGYTISEVTFDDDEEIIGVNGTSDTYGGSIVISSLAFVTNKRIHGPLGSEIGMAFTVPWEKGSFAGFYGVAGTHLDGIGIYIKSCDKNICVGPWGRKAGGPENQWFFQLVENHHLNKIIIDHGDLVYSLLFTTVYSGVSHTSNKLGASHGGYRVSEVMFDSDEEIVGIEGTIGECCKMYSGNGVISSLSFVTNKTSHGPFGKAKGSTFIVPWDKGSFAGFYGFYGDHIDGIGIFLKPLSQIEAPKLQLENRTPEKRNQKIREPTRMRF